jgi:hypothetical protein
VTQPTPAGHFVPPIFAEGIKHAFGVDLADLVPDEREPIIRVLGPADCTCPNRHPHLDEFVAERVNVHFEQMGDAQFWIGVHDPATGRMWHINCGAANQNARGYAFVEEDHR